MCINYSSIKIFLYSPKCGTLLRKSNSSEMLPVWEEGMARKPKNVVEGVSGSERLPIKHHPSKQTTYLTILPEQQNTPSVDESKSQEVPLKVVLSYSQIFLDLVEFLQPLKPC